MKLSIDEARRLIERVLAVCGQTPADAALIADHLIDSELRGQHYFGLARTISVFERLSRPGDQLREMRITRESPVSAHLDGGGHIGYVVAHRAMEIAIDKALASGIAVVGASDTYYTGSMSYYAEMATRRGLVAMLASNTTPWVAPYGATEGRFGTNPICFAFPSAEEDRPVVWDIGTSAIIHADVTLHRRLGKPLPEGVAYDPSGAPTRDPVTALTGALAAWGGPRGSGLAIMVQLLGVLAGSEPLPPEMAHFGHLTLVMRPDLMGPEEVFRERVSAYARSVRAARPVAGGPPVRMPFARSLDERRRRLAADEIEVLDEIHAKLMAILGRG